MYISSTTRHGVTSTCILLQPKLKDPFYNRIILTSAKKNYKHFFLNHKLVADFFYYLYNSWDLIS